MYAIIASCLVVLLGAGLGHAIAGGHVYWLVYLCWIGAVPPIVVLGLLLMPPDSAPTPSGVEKKYDARTMTPGTPVGDDLH
jgi:hypothetical protein